MEIKKLEKCDYVMFPRLQEQGVESRHVEREAFHAELKHVEGHGDYWLVYQQAPPHLVANIQFAGDEAEFDRKLGWFIGQQARLLMQKIELTISNYVKYGLQAFS